MWQLIFIHLFVECSGRTMRCICEISLFFSAISLIACTNLFSTFSFLLENFNLTRMYSTFIIKRIEKDQRIEFDGSYNWIFNQTNFNYSIWTMQISQMEKQNMFIHRHYHALRFKVINFVSISRNWEFVLRVNYVHG